MHWRYELWQPSAGWSLWPVAQTLSNPGAVGSGVWAVGVTSDTHMLSQQGAMAHCMNAGSMDPRSTAWQVAQHIDVCWVHNCQGLSGTHTKHVKQNMRQLRTTAR